MKPFSKQESVMNAALNHYFHDHDEDRKKVYFHIIIRTRRRIFEFYYLVGTITKTKENFCIGQTDEKIKRTTIIFHS